VFLFLAHIILMMRFTKNM